MAQRMAAHTPYVLPADPQISKGLGRSPLIGSFRNANGCKHALYTGHGGMLLARSKGDHFFG
jgi:hypothetical protein